MKYLLLIITFFNCNFLVFEHSNISLNPITIEETVSLNQTTLAEQFYDRLEIKTNLPIFTNRYINQQAATRTDVPASVWQTIKNSVNYSYINRDIVQSIEAYYNTTELQALINEYADKSYIPITKIAFRNELAGVVGDFANDIIEGEINPKLIASGYTPIIE